MSSGEMASGAFVESRTRRRLMLGGLAAAAMAPLGAVAQGISKRPVHILLAQTVASTPDVIARLLAPRFQQRWNQPFIVENRPGAAGAIGMEALAKSAPDGHTIQIMPSSILTLPLFFHKLSFDVLNGFQAISMVGNNNFALVVHNSVPASNVREFIAYAKANPGMNYASPGNGTSHHLYVEQLKLAAGIQLAHIPYKGSAPAFNDLVAGHVSAMFMPIPQAMGLAKDGRVKLLGGSMRDRSPLYPDLPSIAEQGVPDFNGEPWFGLWGPAGIPSDIVAKYNAELRSLLAEPDVRENLASVGVMVKTSTPEELVRALHVEYEALVNVVRAANIKAD